MVMRQSSLTMVRVPYQFPRPARFALVRDISSANLFYTGSSSVRAGWSFESTPRLAVPPIMAKYRDRKLGKTFSFAGWDSYSDTTARSHIRNAFEQGTGIVANWDVMEHVLDYIFLKLGMNGVDGNIDKPIVMTEAVANLPYSRKCESIFPDAMTRPTGLEC